LLLSLNLFFWEIFSFTSGDARDFTWFSSTPHQSERKQINKKKNLLNNKCLKIPFRFSSFNAI
jgi:hypothetical protein